MGPAKKFEVWDPKKGWSFHGMGMNVSRETMVHDCVTRRWRVWCVGMKNHLAKREHEVAYQDVVALEIVAANLELGNQQAIEAVSRPQGHG